MQRNLVEAVTRYLSDAADGLHQTPVEGMHFIRMSERTAPGGLIYNRSLCITIQGAKEVAFGECIFDYSPMSYLLIALQMPAISRVTCASAERPYLGIVIDLDEGTLRDVIELLDNVPEPSDASAISVFSSRLDADLGDCLVRLVGLLENPRAIRVLHAGIMRELCFWLLTGPHGPELYKLVLPSSHMRRVVDAISVLRENFRKPVRIECLAEIAQMSPSSFHHHFKALTAMTPIQFQKQLRLMEARRLMTSERLNVTHAAFSVGYESSAQFSREYSRMFGAPPKRDMTNFRSSSF